MEMADKITPVGADFLLGFKSLKMYTNLFFLSTGSSIKNTLIARVFLVEMGGVEPCPALR